MSQQEAGLWTFFELLAEPADDDDEETRASQTVTAVAGSIAGFVAETLLHPLDTISARAKVHPEFQYGHAAGALRLILKQEGWRGVFAGISVTALVAGPSTGVYFWTYEHIKRGSADTLPTSLSHFVAGASAELVSTMAFYPLYVVRTRLQLGMHPSRATGGFVKHDTNYRSFAHGLSSITRREGVRGLFAGASACILSDCTFSAFQFVFYEKLKMSFRKAYETDPTVGHSLLFGGLAGGAAAVITNPLDAITARMMVQGSDTQFGRGLSGCVRMLASEGMSGLMRGSIPRVLHVMPFAAIQFGVYEFGLRMFTKWGY